MLSKFKIFSNFVILNVNQAIDVRFVLSLIDQCSAILRKRNDFEKAMVQNSQNIYEFHCAKVGMYTAFLLYTSRTARFFLFKQENK